MQRHGSASEQRGARDRQTSQLFYERLGEQIANELVEWFNDVDATYRADLRELNELNFGRFDAKLEQRITELDARLSARIETVRSDVLALMERRFADQGRWFLAAWASLMMPVIAVLVAIVGLWLRR